jgi:hydroxypyruvate isomerase
MPHDLQYAANCSLLFTEWPLTERPAAARDAGFNAIGLWWPWPDQPVPPDTAVDELVGCIRDAGVSLIGLNFFAGDLAGPDCGVLSLPGRGTEFRDNVAVAVGMGEQLGVPAFNALYGVRLDDVAPEQQDELALENLRFAAEAAAGIGGTVLADYADRIAHVQIADWPGRHEPGSGTLDLGRYLDAIAAGGYTGSVALEYVPSSATLDSLRWFNKEKAKRA